MFAGTSFSIYCNRYYYLLTLREIFYSNTFSFEINFTFVFYYSLWDQITQQIMKEDSLECLLS